MATGAKATVRLKFATQKQLSTILEALTPEANAPVTRRANVKLEKDGLFLVLTVEARRHCCPASDVECLSAMDKLHSQRNAIS